MGRRLATALAGVAFALCAPAAASAAQDPFFGTLADDNALLPLADRNVDMDNQAAAGFGVIRQHVIWSEYEPAVNTFNKWGRLDEIVGEAARRNLSVLPVIYGTPDFYKPADAPANRQVPPADPNHLGRFMQQLAQRYGPNGKFWCLTPGICGTDQPPYRPITAWQIWNEPNHPSWWKGSTDPDPNEYLDILKQAHLNLKLVDPTSEVVMAGLAPTFNSGDRRDYRTWLEGFYDAGAAPYFDTLAIHAYGLTPEDAAAHPRRVREIAAAKGEPDVPIWITEYGWANGGSGSFIVTNTDCQAARVHKATVEWRRLRDELKLRGAVQFQWRDVATTRTSWPFYAGLNTAPYGSPPKPALAEIANAIAYRTPDARYTVGRACSPDSPEDKALAHTATASGGGGVTGPERAVDGLSNTLWNAPAAAGQWLQVDLGASRLVARVTLNWGANYASRYRVETSTNGTTFVPADDVTIDSAGPRTSTFTQRTARYVRVASITTDSPADGISLWDLEVFGGDEGSEPPPPPSGPPPPPPTAARPAAPALVLDVTPPRPAFTFRGLSGRSLLLTVRCGAEPCTAALSVSLSVPGAAKTFRLKRITRAIGANRSAKLRLRLPRAARRALRSAKARRRAKVRVTLRVTDAAGNGARRARTMALKRR